MALGPIGTAWELWQTITDPSGALAGPVRGSLRDVGTLVADILLRLPADLTWPAAALALVGWAHSFGRWPLRRALAFTLLALGSLAFPLLASPPVADVRSFEDVRAVQGILVGVSALWAALGLRWGANACASRSPSLPRPQPPSWQARWWPTSLCGS